ncbi:L-histidine N(alpha)-methyltransferase [Candidatus Kapabacteria bacterium]|nr:L-histidine N(alpha)-methyltransferase [Candidatus Kapabacteria bacterium]
MDYTFAASVKDGLQETPKRLSSKYFYDEAGSKIFQKIMKMPEYYLTDSEFEILETNANRFFDVFASEGPFDLVELGSGDAFKTKILLKHLLKQDVKFTYVPIDISEKAMIELEKTLHEELTSLNFNPIVDDYFYALDKLSQNSNDRKVVLFLGSNIGNFENAGAAHFLKLISEKLRPDDLLLVGFDLKKDPQIILNAYSDPHGITSSFNFNLLDRINKEFDGDFDKDKFKHHVSYNPVTGQTESYLVALKTHMVEIKRLKLKLKIQYAEPICMELSQKFDTEMINNLAENSEFAVQKNFFDSKGYFCDSLWKKV